ncbi:RNA 2',3'-cyclic phosphodiesterase [Sporosarcina gallistercoris]|uniref:RNA 2',3'-cyclic phosphodiesterase n=1 Tax=Sporosarcina gallistercoris TaxID=2762245 RepID=UPI003D29AFAE
MNHYFAAIPIPYELVKEKITESSHQYELAFHYKVIPHPDDLHITLLFFGALTPSQLELVQREMGEAATKTDEFTLSINGVSFFGNPSGPRVVYMSVQENPQLTELYHLLGERLESILQKPATIAYTPHITLAKKRKDTVPVPIQQEHFEPLAMNVSEMVLYSIDPSSSPKYSPVSSFSFEDSSRIDD